MTFLFCPRPLFDVSESGDFLGARRPNWPAGVGQPTGVRFAFLRATALGALVELAGSCGPIVCGAGGLPGASGDAPLNYLGAVVKLLGLGGLLIHWL